MRPSSPPHSPVEPTDTKPSRSRASLLILQSILCGIVVLLAVLLRAVGGPLFEELRQSFRQAAQDHRLSEQWENAIKRPSSGTGSIVSADSGTTTVSPDTASSSAGKTSEKPVSDSDTTVPSTDATVTTAAASPKSEETVPGTSSHD